MFSSNLCEVLWLFYASSLVVTFEFLLKGLTSRLIFRELYECFSSLFFEDFLRFALCCQFGKSLSSERCLILLWLERFISGFRFVLCDEFYKCFTMRGSYKTFSLESFMFSTPLQMRGEALD
ncbi:hypothetical protein KFK09_015152 [Dendrobium nobile]|uniref:Uncharacterized protein n=1 Tax=Dendrobium nobile TaxID=94219 RepID=A0A8T3B554_DENNO|nr:hypothetical protein KFK09_015152 [Dendrobium nobile]